ncbi:ComEC/Rec2 family competence protein [Agromyces ramosus]|uniref:Competence protein ComEC n=1 Tax=Agromyces ramosus TaxID=33879 RepID=A0ABU0RF93_9MICO|nr:ComEC/Rec2 family competence protein [Agromyces ramosus]MDQ0895901.1 competence protein ComEC [Agromyces ramosus]
MPDLRLLAPACFAWLAAWLAVAAPDAGVPAWALATACWSAAVVVLALRAAAKLAWPAGRPSRRSVTVDVLTRGTATALAVLAACALVATAAATALDARTASPLAAAAGEFRTARVVMELTAAPRSMPAPWSHDEAVPQLRVEGRAVGVDDRTVAGVAVVAMVSAVRDGLQLGTRLTFEARVAALPASEGAAFRLRPIGEVQITSPPPWLRWSAGLRVGFADAAERLGGDGGALVPGLAIGDTSAVGSALDEAMKASSLSHLTAVSGANCAIVTAAAFAAAGALRVRRTLRVVVAVAALVGFIALVTPEASVVRAGTMAVVVLVAIAVGRPGGGVAALCLAVIVLLVVDPWYARDYGFALSVCATAGLLLLAGPVARVLARVMPLPMAAVLGVPLAAQLACQPVLVLLDPGLALYGVPANLLAAPAAPVGTIVGLVGCLLLPVLPSLAFACLQLAWLPASWIALVAHGASELPFGRLPWLPDGPGAILIAACTALALWLALERRSSPRLRATAWSMLLLALAIPVGVLAGAPAITAATRPGDWSVAACDIGQGDAVFLRSGGQVALIDTGPDPAALERCRSFLGIDRIDLLVVTHWDADHAGGVDAVVGRVDTMIHGPLDGTRSSRVLDPLVGAGTVAVEVVAGHRGSLGDARWRVLWPEPGVPPGNDASVVLEVDTPAYTGVFLGDLGEEAQTRMLVGGGVGPVDLVKVAHHGSADQSDRLYEVLRATVGIIGVGADNGYGHPTERLLELLEETGTSDVRTDRSGTSLLTADGNGFRLWSERAAGDVGARP